MHIDLLWFYEKYRKRGYGKELLDAAENHARKLGAEKAFVETTSWQAKPFYEKQGYNQIASIDNRPKGYTTYYLTKDLILPNTNNK